MHVTHSTTHDYPAEPSAIFDPQIGLGRRALLRQLIGAAAAVGWALCSAPALAQSMYPAKAVRIIVGFPPGGPTDIAARVLAEHLARMLGQPFLIENRAGANAIIGTEAAAQAAPDGYSLLMAAGNHTINPALHRNLRFDTASAFAPIAISAVTPNVLVVNSAFPATNYAEFLAVVRSRPGRYSYGSSGNGGTVHLAGEMFKSMTRTFIVHVPYRGAAPAVTDLLGGQIDMSFASLGSVLPHIKSGKLRAIAVASASRSNLLPEVPTFIESGLREFRMETWYGLLAPAGTPATVVEQIAAEVAKMQTMPGVRDKLAAAGMEATYVGPKPFSKQIGFELATYAKLVRDNQLKVD